MTNPVDPNKAAIPSISTPMVDPNTGTMLSEWYRWALAMFNRTGGSSGANTTDASELAQEALTTAESAQTSATSAINSLSALSSAVTTAQTTATAALGTAQTANTTASGALTRDNNLADLSSLLAARSNLGIATIPLSFSIPAPAAGSQYMPIVRKLSGVTVSGAKSYCGTPPTSAATFTLKVVRVTTGAVETIGTITHTAHSYAQNTTSVTQTATLNVGDTLQLTIPTTDAAEVGITIVGTLA